MEDSDEPYLDGIKYHAMPPLKRFRDMEHLSGGEKTMAALALLFAVHSYQPSPFFVLDEVDAALDNANVAKIANYIRDHAAPGMQFIVISLKTGLFQNSEALVGIYRDQAANTSKALTLDSIHKAPSPGPLTQLIPKAQEQLFITPPKGSVAVQIKPPTQLISDPPRIVSNSDGVASDACVGLEEYKTNRKEPLLLESTKDALNSSLGDQMMLSKRERPRENERTFPESIGASGNSSVSPAKVTGSSNLTISTHEKEPGGNETADGFSLTKATESLAVSVPTASCYDLRQKSIRTPTLTTAENVLVSPDDRSPKPSTNCHLRRSLSDQEASANAYDSWEGSSATMHENQRAVHLGRTSLANACVERSANRGTESTEPWIRRPSAGHFPSQLLSIGSALDLSNAKLSGGQSLVDNCVVSNSGGQMGITIAPTELSATRAGPDLLVSHHRFVTKPPQSPFERHSEPSNQPVELCTRQWVEVYPYNSPKPASHMAGAFPHAPSFEEARGLLLTTRRTHGSSTESIDGVSGSNSPTSTRLGSAEHSELRRSTYCPGTPINGENKCFSPPAYVGHPRGPTWGHHPGNSYPDFYSPAPIRPVARILRTNLDASPGPSFTDKVQLTPNPLQPTIAQPRQPPDWKAWPHFEPGSDGTVRNKFNSVYPGWTPSARISTSQVPEPDRMMPSKLREERRMRLMRKYTETWYGSDVDQARYLPDVESPKKESGMGGLKK
ncbi:MAG: hypothetical protein Q9171_003924 [Xanthocarpia ochracea]